MTADTGDVPLGTRPPCRLTDKHKDSLKRDIQATPPFVQKRVAQKNPGQSTPRGDPCSDRVSVLARCWICFGKTARRQPTFSATRRHHPTGSKTAGTPRPNSSQITRCEHQIDSHSTAPRQLVAMFSTPSHPVKEPVITTFFRGKTWSKTVARAACPGSLGTHVPLPLLTLFSPFSFLPIQKRIGRRTGQGPSKKPLRRGMPVGPVSGTLTVFKSVSRPSYRRT